MIVVYIIKNKLQGTNLTHRPYRRCWFNTLIYEPLQFQQKIKPFTFNYLFFAFFDCCDGKQSTTRFRLFYKGHLSGLQYLTIAPFSHANTFEWF